MASINRGDNTGAFGNDFLRIYLNNPNNLYITKAVFQINEDLVKTYEEPVFPLRVNFRGNETELLGQVNTCKLALWDEFGRRRTADGKFTFMVKENNILEPDNPSYDGTEYYPNETSITFDLSDVEFAAEFVINATPTKMSELQQDIPIMTPSKIIGGRNITTHVDKHDNVIIEAELETETNYEDLYNKPSINGIELIGNVEIHLEEEIPQSDWAETDINSVTYIKNKPELRTVAYTGSYNDLVNCPAIPVRVSQLTNDVGYVKNIELINNYYNKHEIDTIISTHTDLAHVYERIGEVEAQEIQDVETLTNELNERVLQSDFNNTVSQLRIKDAEIRESVNNIQTDITTIQADLNNKATTQALNIITNKVEDCVTNEQLDSALGNMITAEIFTTELSKKVNKASLYNGKLTILKNNENQGEFTANSNIDVAVNIEVPTKVSELDNDSNFITNMDISSLATKAELSNEIERKVNTSDLGKGNLILKINNDLLDTFNANASSSKTVNIEIPTKVSELEQDVEYLKDSDLERIRRDITYIDTKIAENTDNIDSLLIGINKKVDSRAGYSLLANTEINRLSQLYNYDDTEINNRLDVINNKVDNYDFQIDNKVDKIDGKGLSTNDYTEAEKNKVDITYNRFNTISSDVNTLKTVTNTLTDETISLNENLEALSENLNNETTNRQNADNYLQSQIDGLHAKSTVIDILGTEEELWDYDTSKVQESDVICVLKNSLYDDTTTYYRWGYQVITYDTNKQFNKDSNIKIVTTKNLYFKATINGGYSEENEPLWFDGEAFEDFIEDGPLTWTKTDTVSTAIWQSNYVYKLGDTITVGEDTYYTVTEIANYGRTGEVEPEWEENDEQLESVIDGSITWVKIEKPETMQWMFIGSEGHYYTKAESDSKYALNSISINGFDLTDDIFLTAENIGALPLNTVIGNGTLTIQTNGVERGTFTANSVEHVTINLDVPNDLSDLTNISDDKYITESDLTNKWIGTKPENTLIQDEITNLSLQVATNSAKISTLEGNLPDVALTGNYYDLTNIPTTISTGYKTYKDEGAEVATYHSHYTDYIDSVFITELKTKTHFVTMADIIDGFEGFALKTEIPTKISQLENDRGYMTAATLGKGTLSIKLQDTEIGVFNANSKEDVTVTIPIDDALNIASNNLVRNRAITTVINQNDANAVHISGAETITGNKTFSGNTTLQNVTLQNAVGTTVNTDDNSTKLATTAWVRGQGYAIDSNVVHNSGSETIRGEKTFSSNIYCVTPNVNDNSTKIATTAWVKSQGYGTNTNVVHISETETISGEKTFTATTTFSGTTYLSGTVTHVNTPDGTVSDAVVNVAYVNEKLGDIESILDSIIAGN